MVEITRKISIVNNYIDASTPPVQTIPLANALGIKVYHIEMPDYISGKIMSDTTNGGSSGFAIFVNQGHHENRRRFTTAHEIAHFVLHEHLIGDGVTDDALYRSGLSNREEAQANQMAANILMPWHHLNPAIKDNIDNEGFPSVENLSKKFGVSQQAMEIRLRLPT